MKTRRQDASAGAAPARRACEFCILRAAAGLSLAFACCAIVLAQPAPSTLDQLRQAQRDFEEGSLEAQRLPEQWPAVQQGSVRVVPAPPCTLAIDWKGDLVRIVSTPHYLDDLSDVKRPTRQTVMLHADACSLLTLYGTDQEFSITKRHNSLNYLGWPSEYGRLPIDFVWDPAVVTLKPEAGGLVVGDGVTAAGRRCHFAARPERGYTLDWIELSDQYRSERHEMSDYRQVDGAWLPFRIDSTRSRPTGLTRTETLLLTSVARGPAHAPDFFDLVIPAGARVNDERRPIRIVHSQQVGITQIKGHPITMSEAEIKHEDEGTRQDGAPVSLPAQSKARNTAERAPDWIAPGLLVALVGALALAAGSALWAVRGAARPKP